MGDIADMMLEGLLDEETGEYIGDSNLEEYGTEAPGFPRSIQKEQRIGIKAHEEGYHDEETRQAKELLKPSVLKVTCPVCKKRVKVAGIKDHCKALHKEFEV